MKNKDFTLGFKLYTDGDLCINNYDNIDKDLIRYVDEYTYFLVKTWDHFDYAKEESLKILNSIYDNLDGRDYTVELIRDSIKHMIDRLEILSLEGLLKISYAQSLYESYGGNQRLDIEFVYGKPDYCEFREFNLLDRLEAYIETLPNGGIKDSLINLSMGRKYNNGVIKYHKTGIYSGYSGDISELIKANNPDIPSIQSEENK